MMSFGSELVRWARVPATLRDNPGAAFAAMADATKAMRAERATEENILQD